ncbi:GNAT family N-acetyltransferase [Salsipaludibacter albus]|uniref:GNAT family N-acetyltransferase n=1 Tax=Salsipaludibacter albus TaxID=2849650 RepID=UPI001EE3CECD|nr:GNAT family N-acetyltransferase [Salsipaludibacter albus]MBY5160998.1 GNAT family N-acetyltransferase [Salsipaludibacter albus]
MELTTAGPDDAAWLAPLAARWFRAAFVDANDPDDVDAYVAAAFHPDQFTAELADPRTTTLLARDVDASPRQVLGYAMLVAGAGPNVVGERPVELRRLYVETALTGRGLGGALLELALARCAAAGHDVAWLGVWEHAVRAIGFYTAHGFRRVGSQPFTLGSRLQTDLVLARVVAP